MVTREIKKGDTVEYWYSVKKQIKHNALILSAFTEKTFIAVDLTTNQRFRIQSGQIVKIINA